MKLQRHNFVVDRILKDKAYPALARWVAEPYTQSWREFGQHYPNTVPVDLFDHCRQHDVDFSFHLLNSDYPDHSYYFIAPGFFNFDIDYISLLDNSVLQGLKTKRIKLVFYYHEGDNPYRIKSRLDALCLQHNLDIDCYCFVSANTAADLIPNFAYFACHEFIYWWRNKDINALPINVSNRNKNFTVLSRTHKWWRATVMADMYAQGLLDHSYFSYNTDVLINDLPEDNPIEVDTLGLQSAIDHFISQGPYVCDTLDAEQHNNHHLVVPELFNDAYFNIVLETHFDADQSNGAFITEKTYKCIKHGQPFIIVGPPGTLSALRQDGYRTFDHVLDNSYDLELNNTQRWLKVKQLITDLSKQDLHSIFLECVGDLQHNQQLFLSKKPQRLNKLLEKLGS